MQNLDVPQLVRTQTLERKQERVMAVQTLYTPPLDGSEDTKRGFDLFIANRCLEILMHHYPGYPWDVVCRSEQGLVYFGIPVLMGPTLRWAIKLGQWSDMNPKLVIDGGGELLERFFLPRRGFEVMSFIEARDNKGKAQIDFRKRA